MRKIEEKMLQAWNRCSSMGSGNTSVISKNGVTNVYLHGNLIASKQDVSMLEISNNNYNYCIMLNDGTYPSRTTASRLRALTTDVPVKISYSSNLDEIIFTETKDGKTEKSQKRYLYYSYN